MKIIIYIRTSTQEQNPENQLKDCELINSYGEYQLIEERQSAFKDDKERIKFEELKKLIKKNKVKHLICWDLDRLYRNRKKLIEFFELCKMYNCQIHSYRQDWLEQLYKIPEPFNEIMHTLMLNLMGWLGEDESKKRSDRISRAVRKKDGITKSYKGNKWGRRRKPINEEYILELYKQGYSTYQIAKMYSDNPKFKSNISHQTAFNIIKKSSSNITKQK